jgi:hypothetical protein
MRFQPVVFLLLAVFTARVAAAQSVYHLQYNFNTAADTTSYTSFLLLNNNGSGLMKIKYKDPVSGQDVLVQRQTEEQYLLQQDGIEDTNTLLVRSIPNGNDQTAFADPVIIFRLNPATGYFEPAGISKDQHDPVILPATFFKASLLEQKELKKEFVLQFFNKNEEFYTSLFRPRTRGFSPAEKNIKFHLIVVGDIEDSTIGPACNKDLQRTVETFDSLRRYLGITGFITTTIAGKELSKTNVLKAVETLAPAANDIVVFYYSGHGFRTVGENRAYPNMKLKTFHTNRKDVLDNSLNIEDIFVAIKNKGARFNLVMSDCCNDDILSTNISGTKPGKTRGSGIEWSENNVRALFLDKKPVSILVTAALSGQRAASHRNFGSFFSYFFKTSLEDYASRSKNNVSWEQLLQETKKQTILKANRTYCAEPKIPENVCQQVPLYRIE